MKSVLGWQRQESGDRQKQGRENRQPRDFVCMKPLIHRPFWRQGVVGLAWCVHHGACGRTLPGLSNVPEIFFRLNGSSAVAIGFLRMGSVKFALCE
jgi:hypothetical protein